MSDQAGAEEEGGLEEFAKIALRRPMRGSWESLLCQHLVQSVNSDAPQKVRLICEGAYMAIDKAKVDMGLIDRIYRVASALVNTKEEDFTHVAWPFPETQETYDLYIGPWYNDDVPLGFTTGSTGLTRSSVWELEDLVRVAYSKR